MCRVSDSPETGHRYAWHRGHINMLTMLHAEYNVHNPNFSEKHDIRYTLLKIIVLYFYAVDEAGMCHS